MIQFLRKAIWGLLLIGCTIQSDAQDQGVFSGNFETNFNVFLRDSLINANNTPQYDRQLTGGEAWLNLNYSVKGYNLGVRFDMFNNSNLLNPTGSYTAQGIGRWFINKQINKFNVEVGYIYDQIGSGIIYRAWESRPLLIDNALVGAKVTYDLNENWTIKGFSGRQKFLFDVNPGTIKGGSIEGFLSLGSEDSPINLSPGFGIVNRTLSDESMDRVIDNIKTYLPAEQVIPVYNTYLASFYNTLSYKNITWYVEGAYKTPEAFFDSQELKTELTGQQTFGKFRKDAGSIIYSSVSYAKNSELAYQADVRYRLSKKISFLGNFSNITELDGDLLYREILGEVVYKHKRQWQLTGGLQIQNYNQEIYEVKPDVPLVQTVTPYLDFLYKFSRKKSLRFETQYMSTKEDFGSWFFALAEYGLAPHWIFEASVMYNIEPSKKSPQDPETGESLNIVYPTLGVVYVNKANRFQLRYVKQVEGIVCSGGICRLEPAFSGVKFSISSNF